MAMNLTSIGLKTRHGEESLVLTWIPGEGQIPTRASFIYKNFCREEKKTHRGIVFSSTSEEKAVLMALTAAKSFLKDCKQATLSLTDDLYKRYMDLKQISLF